MLYLMIYQSYGQMWGSDEGNILDICIGALKYGTCIMHYHYGLVLVKEKGTNIGQFALFWKCCLEFISVYFVSCLSNSMSLWLTQQMGKQDTLYYQM